MRQGPVLGAVAALIVLACGSAARGEEWVAAYRANWGPVQAAHLQLSIDSSTEGYRDRIRIETIGLSWFLTHFRAHAEAEGRIGNGAARPDRFSALYDLHQRHDSHHQLDFVAHDGMLIAERGPEDDSSKPPLAEIYRRGVVDPISAFAAIRERFRTEGVTAGDHFTLPVFDDTHRFDVEVSVLSIDTEANAIRLHIDLKPIAGFKGETSDDEDPDDAPRPVELSLTNDVRFLPIAMTTVVAWLPLTIAFDHMCTDFSSCQ
jgi:hypothetical protein